MKLISQLAKTLAFGLLVCAASGGASADESIAYQFSIRPWPIRYFLYVADDNLIRAMSSSVAQTNSRVQSGERNAIYQNFEEYFPPGRVIEASGDKLGIVLLSFSNDGALLSPSFNRITFTAAQTGINTLVLIKNGIGDKNHKPYRFAKWWELPGHHIMSPAVCDGTERYRYDTDDPHNKEYVGGFGCREWSAQMQDDDRPYIDVTSYYENDYHVIDSFIGWSAFGRKEKPVIGKHFNTWICLHECPNGEAPGVIRNIEAWSERHGLPLPKPPARQPEFPNSMFQDIHRE
jgi:hypothetical protein